MRKAIGIVRVSKEDGRKGESFSSPKDQCDDMRRLAVEQGWQLTIPEPHEINISGNSQLADRPQLSRAVMAVQTGQADAIVGATTERLWWNQEVRAQVLRLVIEAEGEVWSCDEGLLTTESAAEEFSGTVRLAADRFRRRQDAEKARKAQVRAVARGVVPWSDVTFGYRLIEEGERKGSWEPVPEQAVIVQRAFQMRAERRTIKEVRVWLARQGVTAKPRTCREHKDMEPMEDCRTCCADAKPISYHGVQTLLRSRTLLGEIRFGSSATWRHSSPSWSATCSSACSGASWCVNRALPLSASWPASVSCAVAPAAARWSSAARITTSTRSIDARRSGTVRAE